MTIGEFGIPGFTLMESAGRAAATILLEKLRDGDKVLCCCGSGNNGGDGLVLARVLAAKGFPVDVLLVGDADRETDDNKRNRMLLKKIAEAGSRRDDEADHSSITITRIEDAASISSHSASWIIDALLGTGSKGDLREPIASVVRAINKHHAKVLSLDAPTGVNADTGAVAGDAVEADVTVCFAAVKPGLLMNQGPAQSGTIHTVEIGIPDFILSQTSARPKSGVRPDVSDIRRWLPKRQSDAHKYSSGSLLVVSGSKGLTGAPVLASSAGIRVGAGAVFLATPADVLQTVEQKVVEVMTIGLETNAEGIATDSAIAQLEATLGKAKAIVVGCGLGRAAGTSSFVKNLLANATVPCVVDADALFAISEQPQFIRANANGSWVLTPHQGEFERLIGDEVDWNDRASLAAQYARDWNCVLVLKGNPTVIGFPNHATVFNPTGNEALATAGTGDVLAGMIGGYLAQGLSPREAAIVGTFIGGRTADAFVNEYGTTTMIASDVIHRIPGIVADVLNENR